jgi:hypothetical protein
MSTFRFVTSVLIGPWRATRAEAVSDAVQSRQAVRNVRVADGLEWRVPGRIEQSERVDVRHARQAR